MWIFLAPLPAAATADPFHTYRSLLLYFPLSLLAGKGLEVTYEYISAKKIAKLKHFGKYLFLLLLTFISIISLSAFLFSYVFVNPSLRARYWDYGYKELINIIGTLPKETGIVIDEMIKFVYSSAFTRQDNIPVIGLTFLCRYQSGNPQPLSETTTLKWSTHKLSSYSKCNQGKEKAYLFPPI